MPVSTYYPNPDAERPRIVEVEYICEGCGELIEKFEAFEDTVDEDVRPIHDKASCLSAVEDNFQNGGKNDR